MVMTDEEIARDYRLSKDKKKHIKILAQINATDSDNIKRILKERGEIVEKKVTISERLAELAEETAERGKREDVPGMPMFVREALENEVYRITAQINEMSLEIETAKAKKEQIVEYIRKNTEAIDEVD